MPGIIQETQKRSKEMIEQSMKRIWPGVLTAVVAGAILWLTLAPQPLPEADIPVFEGADKVVHGLMFGGLVFAMVFDREVWLMRHRLSPDSRKEKYFIALFFLLAVLAGGGIELLQGAMGAGRSCDGADFLADAAGAFLSALVSPRIVRCLAVRQ